MAGQKRAAGIAARTISGSALLLFSNLHNGHSDMQCDSRKEMKKKKDRRYYRCLMSNIERVSIKKGGFQLPLFFSSRCCAFSVVGAVYSHATSFSRSSSPYPASRFDGLVLCVPAPAFFFFFFFSTRLCFLSAAHRICCRRAKEGRKTATRNIVSSTPSPLTAFCSS